MPSLLLSTCRHCFCPHAITASVHMPSLLLSTGRCCFCPLTYCYCSCPQPGLHYYIRYNCYDLHHHQCPPPLQLISTGSTLFLQLITIEGIQSHVLLLTAALDMLCCYRCSRHVMLLLLLSTCYAVTTALDMLCCYRCSRHVMLLPLLSTCYAVTAALDMLCRYRSSPHCMLLPLLLT